MTTETKATGDFIKASDLAKHFGVTTTCLSQWIAKQVLPPPWVTLGYTRAWRRADYDAFLQTGQWPKASWKYGQD